MWCKIVVLWKGGQVIQDSINLRRHRNACKWYRENWATPDALYQAICLRDMPPETAEEQELCFHSRLCCWRETKRPRLCPKASVN